MPTTRHGGRGGRTSPSIHALTAQTVRACSLHPGRAGNPMAGKSNPRYANGAARVKLRRRLKAEGRGCWICRAFGRPDAIDYSLPARHPRSFEVDELVPVSLGGNPLDYSNVDATHRECNNWRGNRTVKQVIAAARTAREKEISRGRDLPSRKW